MNYQDSLKFWSTLDLDQESWPFKTIENRMSNKLKKLITLLNHEDVEMISHLKNWSHLKHIEPLVQSDTIYQLNYTRLLKTSKDIYFIGDLHSDARSLDEIIQSIDPYNNDVYLIFLGDYVDRGKAHLETLDKLYSLKLDLPHQVILLRGNHDGGQWIDGDITLPYRLDAGAVETDYFPLYLLDLHKKKSISQAFIDLYFSYCDTLPYLALLYDNYEWYMGVHGGLPRPNPSGDFTHIKSLYDLSNPAIEDHYQVSILNNLFWSDPTAGIDGHMSEKRRFNTYENHFNCFSAKFGIKQIIRGHQSVKDGHRSIYDQHVHTIFSSGNPSKDSAYEEVDTPKYLRLNHKTLISYPIFL